MKKKIGKQKRGKQKKDKRNIIKRRPIIVTVLFILLVALIVGCFAFLLKENIENNESFWTIDAYQVITLIFAFIVSFLLVQRNTNKRILKENIKKLLQSIHDDMRKLNNLLIEEEHTINLTPHLLMGTKTISRKINILKETADSIGIKKNIEYIDNRFLEYREYIGANVTDCGTFLGERIKCENISSDIIDEGEKAIICLCADKLLVKKINKNY